MMGYKTSEVITKREKPVLSYKDVPYKSALTFNAGVVKYKGQYVMLFRNDYGSFENQVLEGTNLGLAYSDDGINWKVEPKPCLEYTDLNDDDINRVYDPRLTVIDDELYVCFAIDTKHGIRGGVGKVHSWDNIEIISMSVPDNRNLALFPEKINGNYVRLERPMPMYGVAWKDCKFDIWVSESPDLELWGHSKLVLAGDDVEFCNDKIGPGAPPIKTKDGWLTIFHSVIYDETCGKNGWEDEWKKKYVVGIMLLDLNDPSKVIGISKEPLLVPELPIEVEGGFRNDALFPCAMILEDNNEVKIYYSVSDTYVCLATADLDDLIGLCK